MANRQLLALYCVCAALLMREDMIDLARTDLRI
jgi:hypothetical protein